MRASPLALENLWNELCPDPVSVLATGYSLLRTARSCFLVENGGFVPGFILILNSTNFERRDMVLYRTYIAYVFPLNLLHKRAQHQWRQMKVCTVKFARFFFKFSVESTGWIAGNQHTERTTNAINRHYKSEQQVVSNKWSQTRTPGYFNGVEEVRNRCTGIGMHGSCTMYMIIGTCTMSWICTWL